MIPAYLEAKAMVLPFARATSTCLSLLRICSGECPFLAISAPLSERPVSNIKTGFVSGGQVNAGPITSCSTVSPTPQWWVRSGNYTALVKLPQFAGPVVTA